MDSSWTLSELVEEASAALARVPAPDNGQVRAVPDERSLRYYTTLGLLDRPAAMRGRTALYGRRHLAQVVAIKRMQTAGKSLAEIQAILAAIDDATLARMSGITLPRAAKPRAEARSEFWRRTPAAPDAVSAPAPAANPIPAPAAKPIPAPAPIPIPAPAPAPTSVSIATPATPTFSLSLRFSLAPGVDLLVDAVPGVAADPSAIAAAARTLLAELTRQGLPEARGDSPRASEPKDGGSR